jgi:hypothetical protein
MNKEGLFITERFWNLSSDSIERNLISSRWMNHFIEVQHPSFTLATSLRETLVVMDWAKIRLRKII